MALTLVVVRAEAAAPELLKACDLPFETLSVVPEPSTTRGEREVARLAGEHGRGRILVVTSTYHVPRAQLTFRRGNLPGQAPMRPVSEQPYQSGCTERYGCEENAR